jgi:hypothetical protein
LQELRKIQEQFETETEAGMEELLQREKAKLNTSTMESLRTKLIAESIKLEGEMAWFQEYRMRMLWSAVRYHDDRKTRYFRHHDDILELPLGVQQKLHSELDLIDRGGVAKN